jgi:transposase-like protein
MGNLLKSPINDCIINADNNNIIENNKTENFEPISDLDSNVKIQKFPSIYEILTKEFATDNSSFLWFLKMNLLNNNSFCNICNKKMNLSSESVETFRCSKCGKKTSARFNTIFYKSNLKLKQHFLLLYHFWEKDKLERISREVNISSHTVCKWFDKYRCIMMYQLLKEKKKLVV